MRLDTKKTIKLFDSCDCDDIWLFSILEIEDKERNLLYPVFYSGRFFTPKDMKRVNPRLMTIINESFEGVIKDIEDRFIKGEIIIQDRLVRRIVSIENDTVLIKVSNYIDKDATINLSSMVGLIYSAVRLYYISKDSTRELFDDDVNNQDIYKTDLLKIKKYIESNSQYTNHLEKYDEELSELNEDLNSNDSWTYRSWSKEMDIDIEIIGIRGEYLEGIVIGKKFPWYNLRPYDELQ